MSSVVHAAQAVVQASVSPSPSASPVAQAAQVVVQHTAAAAPNTPSLQDIVNGIVSVLSPYVVVIGAALASFVQVFLNKLPWLSHDVKEVQDWRRKLLAVAIPLAGTLLAGLATGQNTLGLAPWVFLVAQVLFAAVKRLQATGIVMPTETLAVEEPAVG